MANSEGQLDLQAVRATLQVLAKENPVCTWLASDGRDEKIVYFTSGGVRIYSSAGRRAASLPDSLLRAELVTSEQLEMALKKCRGRKGGSLSEALQETAALPPEMFQEKVVRVVFRELCDLIVWEGAEYEFFTGKPPAGLYEAPEALSATLDVKALADQLTRWLEEWIAVAQPVGGVGAVPAVCPTEDAMRRSKEVSRELGHLLAFINGRRDLRDLSIVSGLDLLDTAAAVDAGVREGFFRMLPPPGEPDRSSVWAEVEEIERGLPERLCGTLARRCLIRRLESLGQPVAMSRQYQAMAGVFLRQGNVDRAIESYRRAIKVSSENIQAHEALIEVVKTTGDQQAAHNEIFSLSKKLLGFGLADSAIEILRKNVSSAELRLDLRFYLVDILVETGRKSEAIEELFDVATLYERNERFSDVEDVCRRILELDPSSSKARSMLRKAKSRRGGRKSLVFHRACATLALLLVGAWGAAEGMTRHEWSRAEATVREDLAHGSLSAGLDRVRSLATKYPGNLLATDLLELEREYFQKRFFEFEKRLDEALQLSNQGQCVEAMETLEVALDQSPVDAQVRRLRQLYDDIENFRSSWLKMRERAEELLQSNFRREAFTIARQVLRAYPEGAQGMKIPFLIQSSTPGARVKLDGELRGYTPTWIDIEVGAEPTVEVVVPGYPPRRIGGFLQASSPFIDVDVAGR